MGPGSLASCTHTTCASWKCSGADAEQIIQDSVNQVWARAQRKFEKAVRKRKGPESMTAMMARLSQRGKN